MSTIKDAVVLITGGASGIGKLMASYCIDEGCRTMVLWDVNERMLTDTVRELSQRHPAVKGYVADVSSAASITAAAERTLAECGPADILVNNAGIIVGKLFHEHTHDEITRTMHINADGVMHVTLAFLPAMLQRDSGHVVTISSAAGMVGNPKMSVYAASKWAAIGWSESLRLEMALLKKNVKVTCVTPYYIDTGMFAGVKSSFIIPINKAETAARKIINGIKRDARYVRMPLIVYTLQLFKGILPIRWFDVIVGQWLKVYHTMDEFTGRTKH